MEEVKKMAVLNTNLKDTIHWYLLLTQPLHKIRKQGINILSLLLFEYYSNTEGEEIDRWATVFNYDTRLKIRSELNNMSEPVFNNELSTLRKAGAIKNNRVVHSFNPIISKDTKRFEMILRFNINE